MRCAVNTLCEPSPVIGRLRNNAGVPTAQSSLRSDFVSSWIFPVSTGYPAGLYDDLGDTLTGGPLTLTPNGTVNPPAVISTTPPAAVWPRSIQFSVGQNQYLSRADEAALRVGDASSVTFAVWVRLEPLYFQESGIISKRSDAVLEYELSFSGTSRRFNWLIETGGFVYSASTPGVALGQWYLVVAWWDGERRQVGISLNNSAPTFGGILGVGAGGSGVEFRIANSSRSGTRFFLGQINSVCRWNRVLNDTERNFIFASNVADIVFGGFTSATSDPPPGYDAPEALPAAPSDLVVDGSSGLAVLEWVNNAVNALGIEIWRSVDGAAYELVWSANAYRDAAWTDTSSDTNQHTYGYKIRAVNYAGASDFTAEVFTAGDALITEDGANILTEDGSYLVTQAQFPIANLTHYWRLDESSGNRADAIGGITLTPTFGTIDAVIGKRFNAANFDAGETLQANLPLPLPFSLVGWIYISAPGFLEFFIDQFAGLHVEVSDSGVLKFVAKESPTTSEVESPTPWPYAAWNLVVCTVDASGVAKVSLNGEAFSTAANPAVALATNTFKLGSLVGAANQRIDEFMLFNRDLTQAEVTQLWNGGAGLFLQ
jgi:hypothetical protein